VIRLLLVLVLVAGMAPPASAGGLDFARQAQQAESKRDFELAAQLYTKALEAGDLDKNLTANALRYRGNANFFLGRYQAASNDYVDSLYTKSDNLYAGLWLYLSREFSGQDGRPELNQVVKRRDLFYWPGPVANLFLGKSTTEEVLQAARDPFLDEQSQLEQSCEAYYYAGQYALLHGDQAEATRLFRAAVATGVTTFIEYNASQLALERLGG